MVRIEKIKTRSRNCPFELFRRPGHKRISTRFKAPNKERTERSTGTNEPQEAEIEAWRLYRLALEDQLPINPTSRGPSRSTASIAIEYLKAHQTTLRGGGWEMRKNHLHNLAQYFPSMLDIKEQSAREYFSKRFGEVLRETVRKERITLGVFTRWAKDKGFISVLPVMPPLPKGDGTHYKRRRRTKADWKSIEENQAMLNHLPEWGLNRHGERYPIRSRFIVQYETSERSSVLDKLRVPDHWQPGWSYWDLPAELIKTHEAVRMPLTDRAVQALESAYQGKPGLLFGSHNYKKHIRAAAKAVLDPTRAGRFTQAHLRSDRITHFLDSKGSLTAAAAMAHHSHVQTTSRYARPSVKALQAEYLLQGAVTTPQLGTVSPDT